MQSQLFEVWIEKGHKQDANLCGAYARPTDERSLVRGEGVYNQGSFVYFTKACGGWVCAGVSGVVCVDVEAANEMTSRHTNVTETNQHPAFVVYRTVEVCMSPHA